MKHFMYATLAIFVSTVPSYAFSKCDGADDYHQYRLFRFESPNKVRLCSAGACNSPTEYVGDFKSKITFVNQGRGGPYTYHIFKQGKSYVATKKSPSTKLVKYILTCK